jgi:hypothetical protein
MQATNPQLVEQNARAALRASFAFQVPTIAEEEDFEMDLLP